MNVEYFNLPEAHIISRINSVDGHHVHEKSR